MKFDVKHTGSHKIFQTLCGGLACVLLATFVCAMPAMAADAANPTNTTLTYSDNSGVSDYAIDIKISKVDSQDHNAVAYAYLQIRDKETNEIVVSEWQTKTTPEEIKKKLRVNRTYILEETTSPLGYARADSIEFTIAPYSQSNASESVLTVLTGKDHAEVRDKNNLVLSDNRTPEYRQEIRNLPQSDRRATKTGLAQTSDFFNPTTALVVALVGAGLVILGIRSRRAKQA